MIISKNNYEAFFLDYHEGNLSEESKKEVLAFVASHPELKEEFEGFEIIALTEKPVLFSGKEKLKKTAINEYNYKTWLVAYQENDLDAEDKKQVEQFIELNPGYKPELEILKQTKILPDFTIRFENKSSLKKGGMVIPLWVRVAAAACLLVGLLSYFVIQQKPKQEIVKTELPKNPVSVPVKKPVIEEIKMVAETLKNTGLKDASHHRIQKTQRIKSIEIKAEEPMANKDSISPDNKTLALQPKTSAAEPQTTIVIHENKSKTEQPAGKLVVLDDNDLAELGLKEKSPEENKSLLADAVNGVGKLFNVNAHYDKEHNPLQAKYTETLALGPVAITRTVSR